MGLGHWKQLIRLYSIAHAYLDTPELDAARVWGLQLSVIEEMTVKNSEPFSREQPCLKPLNPIAEK
jgi:hypothetical protein